MSNDINWNQILDEFDHLPYNVSIQSFCSKKHIEVDELKKRYNNWHDKPAVVDLKHDQKRAPQNYMLIDVNGMKLKVGKNFDHDQLAEILRVMKSI